MVGENGKQIGSVFSAAEYRMRFLEPIVMLEKHQKVVESEMNEANVDSIRNQFNRQM